MGLLVLDPDVLSSAGRGSTHAGRAREIHSRLDRLDAGLPRPGLALATGVLAVPDDLVDRIGSALRRVGLACRPLGALRFRSAAAADGAAQASSLPLPQAGRRAPWGPLGQAPPVAPAAIGVADSGLDPRRVDVDLRGFQRFHPRTGRAMGGSARDHSPRLHGTRVCGLAADRRAGACPGAPLWVAAVLTRVQGAGMVGTEQQVVAGLEWLAAKGAQVINCSFGSPEPSAAWHDIVENLRQIGVVTVAAIGNDPAAPLYPAAFPNTLAVGALASDGGTASFSAGGPPRDPHGRALPGVKPELLLPGAGLPFVGPHSSRTLDGTSFASALCAGLVARLGPLPPGPVDLDLLRLALQRSLTPPGLGLDPLCETRANPPHPGEEMNDKVMAQSAEVRPDDCGFRIEDKNGNLVGVLLNTAGASSWMMNSTNPWPQGEDLTLIPIPDQQSLQLPSSVTIFGGPDSFQNSLTSGAPNPPAAKSARYIVKSGSVVLAFIAVDADGANPTARLVDEFGHPALDDRLPLEDGKRYFPFVALTMEAKGASFAPTWSDHRATE